MAVAALRELQVRRCQTGVAGDPRQHPGIDFIAIVEGENNIRPARTGHVQCEPVWRFTAQPIRNKAAKTRLAFDESQTLIRARQAAAICAD